nr:phage tail protein [Flavimaribacter sediminis]
MRLPEAALTTPQAQQGWEDAFDRSAEPVSLKAGGTEERYRLWGSYSLQERPADVAARMLRCIDGRIVPTPDGGVTLDNAAWEEPDIVLDEDSIIDIIELTRGVDLEQRPNTIRATFLDPDADYATGDADPWEDAADVVARGVEPIDISFPMAPSHGQCRRLMKKDWYRRNPEWAGRFTVNLKGLALIAKRYVRIQLATFGIDHVFQIEHLEFNIGQGGILLGVVLDAIAMPAASDAWSPAAEEGDKPVTTDIEENTSVPVPTGFTVTIERIVAGGQNVPYALLEFDEPPAESLSVKAEYKATADSEWIPISVSSGATEAQSPNLSDGTEYEFQIWHVTSRNRPSDRTDPIVITPTADETAPDPVTGVSATPSTGETALEWTTPNNGNFSRTVIRRNTADDEGTATEIGISPVYGPASTIMDLVDTGLAADDYYYWIYAANASGVESTAVATGVVTVT